MPSHLLLTIDTEEEWDWHAGWPVRGFTVNNIGRLPAFQERCARLDVAVTYFTDHAVMNDAAARAIMLDLARRDDVEVGMHIHPWNTPPIDDSKPVTARDTYLHNLPVETIRAKLTALHDLFESSGLHPTSFRGGRYSSGPIIQEFLRSKGVIADASVVPFTSWPDDGAPDYSRRGMEPVRRPGRTESEPGLWEIPLTRGFTRRPFDFWHALYSAIQHSPLSRLRLIGIAEKLRLVRKLWLNFEQHPAQELVDFVRVLRKLDLPYVCFTLHSSSLLAGLSPYVRTEADEARLLDAVESVLHSALDAGFVPATVSDVARSLEDHHARARHQPA